MTIIIDTMNFLKPTLVGICAIVALSLSAQTKTGTLSKDVTLTNQTSAEVNSKRQLEQLTTQLSLTPEQVEQIHNLNIKVASKIQAINDNTEFDSAKKQEFIRGNREDYKSAMSLILTPEQFETYLEISKPKASDRKEERMEIQDVEKTR